MSDANSKPPDGSVPAETGGEPGLEEASLHAAESPTAVWDEDALRAAGLDIPDETDESAPATAPDPESQPSMSIEVAPELEGPKPNERGSEPPESENLKPTQPGTAAANPGGLSWPATIALAVVLGTAVYFLVRFFR